MKYSIKNILDYSLEDFNFPLSCLGLCEWPHNPTLLIEEKFVW